MRPADSPNRLWRRHDVFKPLGATAITGPNGSGKTTIFNILAGITKADQGQVFFPRTDITRLGAFERCRRGCR